MRLIVLGAAAGGGFPQWNSNGAACRRARTGDPLARPRTQSGIAVSADGQRWTLLNASPDLRSQIVATPALWPQGAVRSSPITGVVLTNADVDAVAGLLHLRERQALSLWATPYVLGILAANPIFDVLQPEFVPRQSLEPGRSIQVDDGLWLEAFPVPGKVPLYREGNDLADGGASIGVRIAGGFGDTFFVPSCARITPDLKERLSGANLVLFEGTFWTDDEMIDSGASPKSGRRMGHVSVSGEDGVIAQLGDLGIARKVFIHVNNTNPMMLSDSAQRAQVVAAGWEVAQDGLELSI